MDNNKTPAERANEVLYHFRTKGSKNGIRLYQNKDGSLTPLGRIHYGVGEKRNERAAEKITKKLGRERAREIAREREREEAIDRADFRRLHDEALREARAEGLDDGPAEARAAAVAAERLEAARSTREARRAAEAEPETPMSEEDRRSAILDSARADLASRREAAEAESTRTDAASTGSTRTDAASTGSTRTDTASTGSTRTDTASTGSTRTDAASTGSTRTTSTSTSDTSEAESARAREAAFNKSISTMNKTKTVIEESGKVAGKLATASDKYINSKPKAQLDLSDMTTEQLREAVNRYNAERDYHNAFAPSTVTRGEMTLNKVLHGAEVTMGVATTAVGLAIAIRKLIGK